MGLQIREDALRKWAERDLRISEQPDGKLHAEFDYVGSTCRNTGWEFETVIHADLAPDGGDWIVEDVRIDLDPQDPGWLETCIHESSASPDPASLTKYAAPKGKRLREFLERDWPIDQAGCLCTSIHVTHKLILALATVQYWLDQRAAA